VRRSSREPVLPLQRLRPVGQRPPEAGSQERAVRLLGWMARQPPGLDGCTKWQRRCVTEQKAFVERLERRGRDVGNALEYLEALEGCRYVDHIPRR
jgi:hypothetical protein